MITYTGTINGITPDQLHGFFVGWLSKPSPETHLKILKNSTFVFLAIDSETNNIIGFINAISDRILSAYIPLLEVLPQYQKQGIGKELVNRMMDELAKFYVIDLCCDENMKSFYQKFGLSPLQAMGMRNYDNQTGVSNLL